MYSVFASVATIIIDTLLSFFLYENILLKEAETKKKAIINIMFIEHPYIQKKYEMKLRKAFSILKTIIIIIQNNFHLRIKNGIFLKK